MSSPWGKVPEVETLDLSEIMNEEIAKDLQAKELAMASEEAKLLQEFEKACKISTSDNEIAVTPSKATIDQSKSPNEAASSSDEAAIAIDEGAIAQVIEQEEDDLLKSDLEIAMVLQHQFDKEYDHILKCKEEKFNGASKVSVSFSNYRRTPLNMDFESDIEEEEEEPNPKSDWDRFDGIQRDYASMPPCGYRIKNGNMVTKHDTTLNSRRNACKMMSFPPEVETGDGAGFDLQLPNKVFNSLRKYSKEETARRHRAHDRKEEHATSEFGMDEPTRLLLYKLINNELLDQINGVISIGKEAVVLHADCNQDYSEHPLPKECVLKVFKTTLSEYKQREKYIKDDNRFKDRIGKQNSKKVIVLWAEKEMRNLTRMKKANILAPDVIALKQHVLVLSFLGTNHKPAPKLKEAGLDGIDLILAYEQVIQQMRDLYQKANLIHADLSEYNILWHNENCYIIDVSQSVEPCHENAFHFLIRDCTNITHFFERKGIAGVLTPEELFKSIVGCEFDDKVGLLELQENFKMKPHLADRDMDLNYNFDQAWERTEYAKKETEKIPPEVEPPVS